MMTEKAWQNLQYFEKEEWVKDPDKVSKLIAVELDDLRGRVGSPCIIHVCWDDSGHSENSYHYSGQAVDFHFKRKLFVKYHYFKEFLAILQSNQLNGIGFYPEWYPCPGWHVDIRNRDTKLFWTRKNGEYRYGIDAILDTLMSFS